MPGTHGPVLLANVATLAIESGPAQIDRYDRQRNINFEIELNRQPLGEVARQALALPSLRELPPGVSQTTVGDAEAMDELFDSFALAMVTGVLCIYIVLVLLFQDFVQPVTILVALVLSMPGAFLALFVTGSALSMPSMIGLIMLMGIATKNSILLVDYAILARRDHGLDRWEALLDACRKRARPIVMTTIAMGAGMLPIAIGLGTDPSFRAPMAIVVIGGLDHLDLPQPAGGPGGLHLRRRRDRGRAPAAAAPTRHRRRERPDDAVPAVRAGPSSSSPRSSPAAPRCRPTCAAAARGRTWPPPNARSPRRWRRATTRHSPRSWPRMPCSCRERGRCAGGARSQPRGGGSTTRPTRRSPGNPRPSRCSIRGRWRLSTGPVRDPRGKLIARFTSIWRLEAPGIWRIVFDSGADACDCAPPRP